VLPHHLQTLVIIARAPLRVPILGLAAAVLFPVAMCAVNSQETLSLGLEHFLAGVVVPSVDEISVEAVAFSNLFLVS